MSDVTASERADLFGGFYPGFQNPVKHISDMAFVSDVGGIS